MMFWSFTLLFFACEFSEQLTKHFEMLEAAFCQCDWSLFPLKMQRMFVAALAMVQQPVAMKGYGNAACTRAAFKNVCVDCSSMNCFNKLTSLI